MIPGATVFDPELMSKANRRELAAGLKGDEHLGVFTFPFSFGFPLVGLSLPDICPLVGLSLTNISPPLVGGAGGGG